jgi:metallophosphoesterase superfamily enzyme
MKLTPEEVQGIKILLAEGNLQKAEIARMYGVGRGTIVDISTGRIHKNVRPTPDAIRDPIVQRPKRKGNVLVIGDLHEPFCLDAYLEFCVEVRDRFKCKTIVFIGDVIDNHYASFHDTDPDGLSGGDELDYSIARIARWVKEFPRAYVTIGNHDRMVMRKAFAGGIPKKWIRAYNEVLNAPGWEFVDEVVIDNVQYIHGEGATARVKARNDKYSTVQGHLHTQSYVENLIGRDTRIFGIQVGCGIDRKAYALAYAKNGPKPAIGCGVVLDRGRLPIQIMAELSEPRWYSAVD